VISRLVGFKWELDKKDADAVRAYLIERANDAKTADKSADAK
jgi:hypothetical protein